MNANYIYDIFTTCEELDLPDLTVALAHHKSAHPIPGGHDGAGHQRVCGQPLRGPGGRLAGHDREAFAAAVEAGIKEDEERAQQEAGQEV